MTHDGTASGDFSAAYRRFARLFNADKFWESHEALEHQWIAENRDSPFLQGLIIFAAAYEQVKRGNPRGARLNWQKARRYLTLYAPAHRGVRVDAMVEHIDRCLAATAGKKAFAADGALAAGEVPRWHMPADLERCEPAERPEGS